MNNMITKLSRNALALRRLMSTGSDVLFEDLNHAGLIILNRPKAMNAFTFNMQKSVIEKLLEWERNKAMIILTGAGGKALCAGGDLIELSERIGSPLFRIAYQTMSLIHNYKIPFLSIMDGVTIGGGMGFATLGRYRVATENTLAAMPEGQVGMHPDGGATYFLPRLPGQLGMYLGLTGARLKGQDLMYLGPGTYYVPSKHIGDLKTAVSKCSTDGQIRNALESYHKCPRVYALAEHMKSIDYCFAADSVEEILVRLDKVDNDWARHAIASMKYMSPVSLKLTLRALRRGAKLTTLEECLQMEYRVNMRQSASPDFTEGVRAMLIDKDKTPKWSVSSLSEVSDDYVEGLFENLPEDQELTFITKTVPLNT